MPGGRWGWWIGYICLVGLLCLMSCASIIHGTKQKVSVASRPSGATVTVDEQQFGTTPLVTKLSRKNDHKIRLNLAGYQPYEIALTKKISGWVWGNVAFGGIIGLVIDAVDGGIYKLIPDNIDAKLNEDYSQNIHQSDDAVTVSVVLESDSSWEKIGQLTSIE